MTISPSGSWIWQNGHYRSIRNASKRREPVWLCWKWVRNGVNRSKHQFWASGGSLGLNREYSIGSAAAIERLDFEVGLEARRGLNMARVCLSRRLPLGAWEARGQTVQNIQVARVFYLRLRSSWFLHQWVRMDEIYTVEWSKLVFDNFENSDISQNTSVFWRTGLWYQLLVGETTSGGFETLRGYKTHCFISTIKSLQRLNKSFEYTPSLFLSSVSFFSFHTE